eukprot:CAMPEP_0113486950 /NCGR_PEP_ID=MMETSP0014_2-20120614/25261_1 /TAXON_ID=2857 /ORGANISM="Nitzschia sp." /LENGTH=262 /DNA_ID=CAMNT_0000380639 /DNA_START=175 /DNA_END=963 /DNA_ORIENTATION=- /assembly_acc=CAM_ASM_000159
MAKKGEETTPFVSAVEAATQQRQHQQPSSAGSNNNNNNKNAAAKPIYTEEKARHLARVYSAILTVFFIQGWLTIMIVNPLKDDEELMENMDPSEIIATPFALQRLSIFAAFPAVIMMIFWLVKDSKKLFLNILSLIKLTCILYVLFGGLGNSLINNWEHTICASLYIATLMQTTSTGKVTSNIMEEYPFYDPIENNALATSRLYTTFLFAIPFQVLTILDHGMQVQRWPLPLIIGGSYGYVLGTIIGICLLGRQNYLASKKK